MLYILGLFLIIGLTLSGFSGSLPFGLNLQNITGFTENAFNDFKQKTYDLIFPKSKNEILVENLKSNYSLLDKFFSESSDSILESKDISEDKKIALKKALEAFNEAKDQMTVLGTELVKNEPGLLESLIKKTLNLKNTNNNVGLEPTHIPPSCRLECSE